MRSPGLSAASGEPAEWQEHKRTSRIILTSACPEPGLDAMFADFWAEGSPPFEQAGGPDADRIERMAAGSRDLGSDAPTRDPAGFDLPAEKDSDVPRAEGTYDPHFGCEGAVVAILGGDLARTTGVADDDVASEYMPSRWDGGTAEHSADTHERRSDDRL